MGKIELICKPRAAEENVTLFKRILVVEEDPRTAADIRDVLDLQFYDVTVAANGTDAVRLLLHESFDAVICDFTTPHFPAQMFFTAVQRVRPGLCRNFIAISNSAQTTKAASKVATLSIWKPVDPQILLEAVETVLRKGEKGERTGKELAPKAA